MALKIESDIHESDEGQLIWYFGDLGTRFERSVFGVMLDQLELGAAFSRKCGKCQGSGIVDTGGFARVLAEVKHSRMVQAETGIGAIPDETKRWEEVERDAAHGGWCKACRGTGALPQKQKGWRGSVCDRCEGKRRVAAFNHKPGRHDAPCSHCLSTGRAPVNACPTIGQRSSTRGAPDDTTLSKFAIISRILSLVRAQRVLWFDALVRYYGDVGQRWALEDHGRLFALYDLTPSGKKLARWAEERSTTGKGSKMPKPKKKGGKPWENPEPAPLAYPFLTFKGMLEEVADEFKELRKRRRMREFIGPVFPDNTRTLSDHLELTAMLGPTRATEHDRDPPATDLTPLERIGVEAKLERNHPNEHRRKLLHAAGEEALDLYRDAARSWNLVSRAGDRLRELHARTVISLRDEALRRGKPELADYILSLAGSR